LSTHPSNAPSIFPFIIHSNEPFYILTNRPTCGHAVPTPISHPSLLSTSVSSSPSLIPSNYPSIELTVGPSDQLSSHPSLSPTHIPSIVPIITLTSHPSDALSPFPFILPSKEPFGVLTTKPTCGHAVPTPTDPSTEPTSYITVLPSITSSLDPVTFLSLPPTVGPPINPSSENPSLKPSLELTFRPSIAPALIPSSHLVSLPSLAPSEKPTTTKPCGLSELQRSNAIFSLLGTVSNPVLLRKLDTPHSKSIQWLIGDDNAYLCPDNTKIIQRYVLALIYFSTNGEEWFQCSSSPFVADRCGDEDPFQGQTRFLSSETECNWAGIRCNEENNLGGTIPHEIAELKELEYWGMERGKLVGQIPTTIISLTNLFFIDLDYNELTGTIPSELLSLTKLRQLDLNDNKLSGSVAIIEALNNLEFLQLHKNVFTGTISSRFSNLTNLRVLTIHANELTGRLPATVCNLRDINGGLLSSLHADCQPQFDCSCCTNFC